MSDLNLQREIRHVLAQLELLSHGTITAYNSSGGHGDSTAAVPPGEGNPPHLIYRDLFLRVQSDDGRRGILRLATAELEAARRQRVSVVGLTDGQILEEKILESHGWSDTDLAQHLRCTANHVRRVRNNNGQDGKTGDALEMSAKDRAELAASLLARGVKQVQIAKRMGISEPTVSRLIRSQRPKEHAA